MAKKTGASKPQVAEETTTETVAETAPAKKKGASKSKPAAPEETSGEQTNPLALANGKQIDLAAARKAIKIYSPKSKIPTDDVAVVELLRKVVAARVEEIAPEERMLCGEQDDETTGCREIATGDILFCPFCGDEGVAEDEAPPAPGVVDDEPVSATEAGLATMRGELDEAVARFDSLRRDLVANAYDIGLTLRDIRDRELWKASGAASLKEYMESHLSISRTSGYRYMALTEEYDRQTFLEIGPKKLSLISGIEGKEDRDAALAAAKEGATTRDLDALANPERTKSSRGDAPPRESGSTSKATPKKTGPEITLLAKVGGKATSIPFRGAESGRPLKHYKAGAYGEFQISDDVVLRVSFQDDKEGNHEAIKIAFVRAE